MKNWINIKKIEKSDLKWSKDLHPENLYKNQYPRVGNSRFDKHLNLLNIIDIASKMLNPTPNIIVKAGPNAKWYIKYCDIKK